MPEFSVDSSTIYYSVLEGAAAHQDERPTLVLLHNFMSTGRTAWGPLLGGLLQRFRVILPDLPGHGRSIGHPIGFNHTVIARQIAALLADLDALDAHLAGCSSGGMIAQLLLYHGLMCPRSLTLVSTTHSVEPATSGVSATVVPERFEASPAWLEATAKLHDPYRYDGYYREVLLPGFRQLAGQSAIDLRLEVLAEWAMPTCIIHGEQDEFFPVFIAERMSAVLPDCQLSTVPSQTHSLIFRQPHQVLELMLAFYSQRFPSEKVRQ